MDLRRIIGIIFFGSLTILCFYLAFENYQLKSQVEKVHRQVNEVKRMEEMMSKEKAIILPVCMKGEISKDCRKLAADETGSTVRGNRVDDED